MRCFMVSSNYRQINARTWSGYVYFPVEYAGKLLPHRREIEWSPSNGVSYTQLSGDERSIVLGFSNSSEAKIIKDINRITEVINRYA